MRRRELLAALSALPLVGLESLMSESQAAVGVARTQEWPLLRSYLNTFMTSDGRVVDLGAGGHSTSEGQAYGMFFALVAGDRASFDLLHGWAVDNLAGGDLSARLPGWKWGQTDEGPWGLVDANSASDADLWMAYALLEGGRLWHERRLTDAGAALLARVGAETVAELPGLGSMMLPGPTGFALPGDRWRLNPSYLPLQLLERARHVAPGGPWADIKRNTVRMYREVAAHDLLPDWLVYSAGKGFGVDPVTGDVGSFDAIRCSLWAATLADDELAKGVVGGRSAGLARHWRVEGRVPAVVQPWAGALPDDQAPIGFLGALLPEVDTWSDPDLSARIRQQIEFEKSGDLYGVPPTYYDHNLLLFGLGYRERRYRFERDGRLVVAWRPR